MKCEVVEADINNLILTFLQIFDSCYFVDVDADFTLLESEIGKKLHYFSKHNVAISKYCLWKL